MACFTGEAKLEPFWAALIQTILNLRPHCGRLVSEQHVQLASASKPLVLSCGLLELYIDDTKATAERTGELNALKSTQCG